MAGAQQPVHGLPFVGILSRAGFNPPGHRLGSPTRREAWMGRRDVTVPANP